MNSVDTERVIIEVQCHPVIWDMSHELYKDRDARQAAWLEICKELFENFEDLSDEEKQSIEKKVQARWKTARDSYTKVKTSNKKLKSGSGAKKGKGYSYYNMMTFLDSNTSDEGQDYMENIYVDDFSADTSILSDVAVPSTSCEVAVLDASANAIPSTSTYEMQKQLKRKRTSSPTTFQMELLQSIKNKNEQENDEDLLFFKSIMPTIKNFSNYQKLLFRSKVITALLEIERENVDKLV